MDKGDEQVWPHYRETFNKEEMNVSSPSGRGSTARLTDWSWFWYASLASHHKKFMR